MQSWKQKLNQKESEDQRFKRLWNFFVTRQKPTQAFELFRVVREKKDPDFKLMPEILQVKEYKLHLEKLGLIR